MTDTCIFNLRFVKNSSLKAIAHWVRNFGMRFSIFFIFLIHSYQNACNGCENAENRTWSELFLTDESFRGSKRDWHNVRSYLFFNVRKCRTQCAETFSVQWPWIPSKWKVAFHLKTSSLWQQIHLSGNIHLREFTHSWHIKHANSNVVSSLILIIFFKRVWQSMSVLKLSCHSVRPQLGWMEQISQLRLTFWVL